MQIWANFYENAVLPITLLPMSMIQRLLLHTTHHTASISRYDLFLTLLLLLHLS